jgi:hypothetical protein
MRWLVYALVVFVNIHCLSAQTPPEVPQYLELLKREQVRAELQVLDPQYEDIKRVSSNCILSCQPA